MNEQTTLPLKPKYTKEFLKAKLSTDKAWAIRGMIAIFRYQTEQEKAVDTTVEDNGIGFSGSDAFILSVFSKSYQKYNNLTDKQMAIVFKKMPKYASQLIRIIERKQ